MHSVSQRRVLFASILCALSLAAASCTTTPGPRVAGNEGLVTGRLLTVNPLEVVVLPVEDHTGAKSVPTAEIREQFQKGLIALRYSPLSLDYLNKNAVEASYKPGALGEHAVLRVVLTGWDDTRWKSHTRLVVDADVYLLDAANPETSMALWGGHATRTIELARERSALMAEPDLRRRAVASMVDGILASLPARNPERAVPAR